ncbi:MAG: DUF4097 domain-containing protein [Clostridiales bacterium]|jgi:DUF4097 and DUF4098 domain-containing protein YvlB|nr:DUF4097 domain-containing protein [Clostridiales bacterium]
MDSDKMMILKMLEEKKISADEAARLLDSLNKGTPRSRVYNSTRPASGNDNSNSSTSTSSPSQPIEEFTSDIAKKFDDLAKELEPKIQNLTKVIVQKTAGAADRLSKTLQTYQATERYKAEPVKPTAHKVEPKAFGAGKEKSYEMVVSGGGNQLNLTSLNGDIYIRGYNGDKITLKVFYKSRNNSEDIEFIKLSNKYLLNYNEDDFESVSIDMFLPEKLFSNIILDTNTGKAVVSTVECEYLVMTNLNGATQLSDVTAHNIKIDCNNNELKLENVKGATAKIENYNGAVILTNLDLQKIKIDSFNCSITANIENFNKYSEYVWEVEASNGKINLNLPSSKDIGYYLNARTSLNNVKIGIVGLSYLANSGNFIEARSIDYEKVPKRVLLRMETSNAPIVIN